MGISKRITNCPLPEEMFDQNEYYEVFANHNKIPNSWF